MPLQGHGPVLGPGVLHQQAGPPAGPHQGEDWGRAARVACRRLRREPRVCLPAAWPVRKARILRPPLHQTCTARRPLAGPLSQPMIHHMPSLLFCPPQDIGLDPNRPETRLYATSAAQPIHNVRALGPGGQPQRVGGLGGWAVASRSRSVEVAQPWLSWWPEGWPACPGGNSEGLLCLVPSVACCGPLALACRMALRTWSPCCA